MCVCDKKDMSNHPGHARLAMTFSAPFHFLRKIYFHVIPSRDGIFISSPFRSFICQPHWRHLSIFPMALWSRFFIYRKINSIVFLCIFTEAKNLIDWGSTNLAWFFYKRNRDHTTPENVLLLLLLFRDRSGLTWSVGFSFFFFFDWISFRFFFFFAFGIKKISWEEIIFLKLFWHFCGQKMHGIMA